MKNDKTGHRTLLLDVTMGQLLRKFLLNYKKIRKYKAGSDI